MRHLKAHRKLGRTTAHRMSMLRNLATSLITSHDERIVTTLPKAKELRPFVERAITLSRRAQSLEGDDAGAQAVHLRRQAAGFFHAGNRQQASSTGRRSTQGRAPRTAGVSALKRLFDELGERYKDRPGGYTRIIKLGRREGDNAELAIIELVDNPREVAAIEAEKKKRAASKKKKTAKASDSKAASGGRRGGRKADKTDEKEETTEKKRGAAAKKSDDKTEANKPQGGRRSKKTESTAAEKETE